MEEYTITITPEMMVIIPAVGIVLQLLKRIPVLDKIKEWFPFVAVGVALAIAKASGMEEGLIGNSLAIGLIASGGYDLLRAPTKKLITE